MVVDFKAVIYLRGIIIGIDLFAVQLHSSVAEYDEQISLHQSLFISLSNLLMLLLTIGRILHDQFNRPTLVRPKYNTLWDSNDECYYDANKRLQGLDRIRNSVSIIVTCRRD